MKLAPLLIAAASAQSGDYDESVRNEAVYQPSAAAASYTGFGSNSFNFGSGGRTLTTVSQVSCWQANGMVDDHHRVTSFDQDGNQHVGHSYQDGTFHTNDLHNTLHFDDRLSGCIYEAPGWVYSGTTYDKIHHMAYTTASGLVPVWWHYFNAHTLAGGSYKMHHLIMANPTYEGLGFLNFIVTFEMPPSYVCTGPGACATTSTDICGVDCTIGDFNGGVIGCDGADHSACTLSTYGATRLASSDLYEPGSSFKLILDGGSSWKSSYDSAGDNWSTHFPAVSSFPHNDLGKDFRFNIRVLHGMGLGGTEFDAGNQFDSYYHFRTNKISINFPKRVGFRGHAMDGVGKGCTNTDNSCTTFSPPNHIGDGAGGIPENQVARFVEGFTTPYVGGISTTDWSDYCLDHYQCGVDYYVEGLMNTYDEVRGGNYGTMQEFWFQFHYMYAEYPGYDVTPGSGHPSLWIPNILFNAFDLTSVHFDCNTNGVYNLNTC